MHLYRSRSSSWSTAGEGINEAPYHCTPACCPKLIESVPEQTQIKLTISTESPYLLPCENMVVSVLSVLTACWRSGPNNI